ncbi:MAG: radical SAM protein [Candidatus Diapherotrites archaeon]|nr:radical SAM protein [Candidatus Diapherotrites archaeon]
MKRIDVKTGYTCNNNCLFCAVAGHKHVEDLSTLKIKEKITHAKNSKADILLLTGGEPTIRHDIFELIEFASLAKFNDIAIESNGRMFSYDWFADKAMSCGAYTFLISFHAPNPLLGDYLANAKGSYNQTLNGLKNLTDLGVKICVNSVIVKPNYKLLEQTAEILINLNISKIHFPFVDPTGNAFKYREEIVPRLSEIAPYLHKAFDLCKERGVKATTEKIPFCYLAGYEESIGEQNMPETEIWAPDYTTPDFNRSRTTEGKSKGPQCTSCAFFHKCEGVMNNYSNLVGYGELKPVNKNNQ